MRKGAKFRKIGLIGQDAAAKGRDMMRRLGRLTLILCALSAGGCATGSQYESEATYGAGYSDGCASASRGGGRGTIPARIDRDETLYGSDKAYRAGWNAGYRACASPIGNDALGRGEWP
jgi:hypothetical protein